jgi:hypothetical protein
MYRKWEKNRMYKVKTFVRTKFWSNKLRRCRLYVNQKSDQMLILIFIGVANKQEIPRPKWQGN